MRHQVYWLYVDTIIIQQ